MVELMVVLKVEMMGVTMDELTVVTRVVTKVLKKVDLKERMKAVAMAVMTDEM